MAGKQPSQPHSHIHTQLAFVFFIFIVDVIVAAVVVTLVTFLLADTSMMTRAGAKSWHTMPSKPCVVFSTVGCTKTL